MPHMSGSSNVFICPSDRGIPQSFPTDPAVIAGKTVAQVYETSYCLNVVMTRLGTPSAIVQPSDTFMGAEIWSWHSPDALQYFQNGTGHPARIGYYCDGHAKISSEKDIQAQCQPPSAPGIGAVP